MTTQTQTKRTFWTRLDNYEPVSRNHFRGTLVYDQYARAELIQLVDETGTFKKMIDSAPNPVFVLDDGKTANPYYVAGYNKEVTKICLSPYPVNPTGETRPDNGRVIDYSLFKFGPRTSYHLKVE